MANFADILDRPMTEVEKPKPLPVGTYLAVVDGQPKFDKTTTKQTDYVEFTMKVLQPGEDVDTDQLAELTGGASGKTLRYTFYLTEDSLYRLKDFLVALGLEEGMNLRQAIAETTGRQIYVKVKHGVSKDGQQVYANIDGHSAV